jgi:hypothetical protein
MALVRILKNNLQQFLSAENRVNLRLLLTPTDKGGLGFTPANFSRMMNNAGANIGKRIGFILESNELLKKLYPSLQESEQGQYDNKSLLTFIRKVGLNDQTTKVLQELANNFPDEKSFKLAISCLSRVKEGSKIITNYDKSERAALFQEIKSDIEQQSQSQESSSSSAPVLGDKTKRVANEDERMSKKAKSDSPSTKPSKSSSKQLAFGQQGASSRGSSFV